MNDKLLCPHCGCEYETKDIEITKSFNKYLCFLGCGKKFPVNNPNLINNLRTIKPYESTATLVRSNKIVSALILLIVLTLAFAGISSFSQQSNLYTAMNSNDTEAIMKAIKNIDNPDNLKLVCDRCQDEMINAAPFSKERDKWGMAAVACLARVYTTLGEKLTYLKESEKILKNSQRPLNPWVLLLAQLITFAVIVGSLFALFKLFKKYGIQFIGLSLIIIGIIGLLGSLAMRTTVHNTYNIGLLHNREIYIILFSSILIGGIITQIAIYIVRNRKL